MFTRTAAAALAFAIASVAAGGAGAAGPGEHHKEMVQAPAPKELAVLKKMLGRWEGKAKMGDQEVPVTIVYESTAGGSAVIERLFPGTPHEMLSVYTGEGDKLVMTHYCAAGNHPKMALKRADGKGLAFEIVGSEGLRSPDEMHMHAMSLALVDADHVRETWTSFEGGAKKDEKTFELARKKR